MFRNLCCLAVLGLTGTVQAQHHHYDAHPGTGHYPAWHYHPEYDYHDRCELAPAPERCFHRPLMHDDYPCEFEYSRPLGHCPYAGPNPHRFPCPYENPAVGGPPPFPPGAFPQNVIPGGPAPGVEIPRSVQPLPPVPGAEGVPDNRTPGTNQPPLPPRAIPDEAPPSLPPALDVPPNAPVEPENGRRTPPLQQPPLP